MAIINEMQINTEAIPSTGGTKYFSVTGDDGAQFMIQAVTSEGVFYNFITKQFTAGEGFNSNHNKLVTLNGQYNSSIHFPSGATTTYSIILITNGFDTTINNDTRKVSVKKITQNSETTVTFAFATDNQDKYSSNPAAANVTSSGTPSIVSNDTVSNISTVTNAASDTHGSGFRSLRFDAKGILEFSGDNIWYYQKTATVNGSSSGIVLTLDSVDGIGIGSEITFITGTTAPGATTIVKSINTNDKALKLSRSQSFSDGDTVTIRSYGSSLINQVSGASFKFGTVTAIRTKLTNLIYTTNGVTSNSNTINLNGSRGLGKNATISAPGLNRSNSGDIIHSVSLSATGGSIVVGDNDAATSGDLQNLADNVKIQTDSINSIDLTYFLTITSYASSSVQINFDLDKILTPQTVS